MTVWKRQKYRNRNKPVVASLGGRKNDYCKGPAPCGLEDGTVLHPQCVGGCTAVSVCVNTDPCTKQLIFLCVNF